MKRLLRTASLLLLLMSLTLVACHPDEDPTSYVAQKNVNINPDKAYARRLEMPHLDNNNRFITHSTIYKGEETVTYSLEYDDAKHHSKWVAFQCYDVVNEKHWYRSNWYNTPWGGDPFQADPNLPSNVCPDRSWFSGSGGVRGHLCASEDRVYSQEANEQTFYYSNMSPMHYDFNGGLWLDLEIAVRDSWGHKASFCDTLYVVKGGTIREGEYNLSNNNRLPIPKHYFTALLCNKAGTYKAIGFWVEHKPDITGSLSSFAVSIDELERLTGIDFFCNLPDKVEEAVESTCYPRVWGLN